MVQLCHGFLREKNSEQCSKVSSSKCPRKLRFLVGISLCFPCTIVQDALLASTSRLLGQGHFVTYKTVTTLYFFFWCIWWPYSNGDDIWEFVTYWSFYVSNVCECKHGKHGTDVSVEAFLCSIAHRLEKATQVLHWISDSSKIRNRIGLDFSCSMSTVPPLARRFTQ